MTAPECLHCGRANLSRIVPCVSAKHRPEYGSVMGTCYSLGSREHHLQTGQTNWPLLRPSFRPGVYARGCIRELLAASQVLLCEPYAPDELLFEHLVEGALGLRHGSRALNLVAALMARGREGDELRVRRPPPVAAWLGSVPHVKLLGVVVAGGVD